MVKIYSIGFEKRSLEQFIVEIKNHRISKICDVRCFPDAESAGDFCRMNLASELTSIKYEVIKCLAPTPELLNDYFEKGISWEEYEQRYIEILKQRKVEEMLAEGQIIESCCFMCLEYSPHQCHRRLALEYLNKNWKKIEIIHL